MTTATFSPHPSSNTGGDHGTYSASGASSQTSVAPARAASSATAPASASPVSGNPVPASSLPASSPALPVQRWRARPGVWGRRALASTLLWLSFAINFGIWAVNATEMWTSAANLLTSLGRLSALLGTNLMFIQLLLVARVPAIDRIFSTDALLGSRSPKQVHRALAIWTMSLLTLHMLTLWAAWSIDAGGIWSGLADLWGTSDIALAIIGTGIMLVVSLTSWKVIRRLLPYEVWHLLHLGAYAALALALPHMFNVGILSSGWPKAFWALYTAAVAFALVRYRFLEPLTQSLAHRLRVSALRWVSPQDLEITFTGRNLHTLGAQAGQWTNWRFLARGLWWHAHPLSFSAAPDTRQLKVIMRLSGAGTRALALGLKVGTPVLFAGPYGSATPAELGYRPGTTQTSATQTSATQTSATQPGATQPGMAGGAAVGSEDLLFVGAGIGVTPILSLLEGMDLRGRRALVLVRAHSAADLPDPRYIEHLATARGAHIMFLTGPRGYDQHGRATWTPAGANYHLGDLCPWVASARIVVCGPQPWMDSLSAEARALGARPAQIIEEGFSL